MSSRLSGRELAWDGCVNVRDLGGLGSVRPGALVRLEAPTQLTAAGWRALWDHGVRTILDLRAADECEPDLAPRPAGLTTVRVPLDPVGTPFYERWVPIDNLATPLYFPALLAEHPEPVVTAVREIAAAVPGGVAFHCAGGKDRTGLLALVLLALAGATPDEIIADYLLTYDRMNDVYAALGVHDLLGRTEARVAQHGSTIKDSLTSTITSLDAAGFLRANGLSEDELGALRARMSRTPDRLRPVGTKPI
ncbi:tyrosine-protein phosphatase [Cryptosporangium sp. NPDC051539]|uniref:tyrosine-protein phosphatase n=1 Tax=Cryptosporangium sp. NPDC051539 TaxID=3363962 RepID=UPI003796857F